MSVRKVPGSFGIVLVGALLCVRLGDAQESEEYSFVGMWPDTPQPRYFDKPSGLAVDSSGNVYVADRENHRIQKFTPDGVLITKWGGEGSGDGELYRPFGVAVDGSGKVYVADMNNFRIQKFTSDGVFMRKWGSYGSGDGEFNAPYGVAVDSSGNVYVADPWNHRIQKFTSDGVFVAKWGSQGRDDGQFRYPEGVAADSSCSVYVADTDNYRVQKFTSDGVFITKWGSYGSGDGEFGWPWGVAVDTSGNVYVADSDNDRIQKFRRTFGMRGISWGAQWPVVEWDSESGKTYKVWVAGPISSPIDWVAVPGTITASDTGVTSWPDDGLHPLGPPPAASSRFYRIEKLP
jgi:tripartite motif-containing protein 71